MEQAVMDPARIITAVGNAAAAGKIKAILAEHGYPVIDNASDGNECLRKIISLRPDLAIIDHGLAPRSGYEAALIASEDKLCDVILLLNAGQRDNLNSSTTGGGGRSSITSIGAGSGAGGKISGISAGAVEDIVMAIKPITKDAFIRTVELVLRNRRKILKLEKEIEELKTTIVTRKEVEKAKGLLIANLKISEDEAFRLIQKQSMDRGMPMAEVAAAINKAYGLKRKTATAGA